MTPRVHVVTARRRMVAVTLALVVAYLWSAPVTAWAHNSLVGSDPADGARLARTPSVVVLTFDEPAIAMGTRIVVTGPGGEVQAGDPVLVDNTVTQALAPASTGGSYVVQWRVTSADGHPITGTFGFTARDPGAPSSQASPAAAPRGEDETTSPPRPTRLIPFAALGVVAVALVAWLRARRPGRRD